MRALLAMHDPGELQAKLNALSDAYAAQLPERLKNLQQSIAELSHTEWNERAFESFVRLVHGLIGSSRTFGFESLGGIALNLEEYLSPLVQSKVVLSKAQREHILEAIDEMRQAMQHKGSSLADQSGLIAIAQASQDAAPPRRIFVVEDERELAEELKVQLGYFGYDVSVFNTLEEFRLALRQTPDDVVVLMDITFPEDRLGGAELMIEIQRGRKVPVPVVFLSAHDDFESRLEAARAGSILSTNSIR